MKCISKNVLMWARGQSLKHVQKYNYILMIYDYIYNYTSSGTYKLNYIATILSLTKIYGSVYALIVDNSNHRFSIIIWHIKEVHVFNMLVHSILLLPPPLSCQMTGTSSSSSTNFTNAITQLNQINTCTPTNGPMTI